MSKISLRITAFLAAATLLLCVLAACGAKDDGNYAGEYVGIYYKYVGDDDSEKVEDEKFSLVLNEDGTGKFKRQGGEFFVRWKLDGEDFSMTETFIGIKNEYSGTLKNGEIRIFHGDKTNPFSCEYVFRK